MNLIYTFTKKLNESNLDLYVQLWCDSYLNNKKYHNIKLYTDDDSVDLFKNVFEDIEILNTNNVKFLDDLKILAFEKCSLDDVLIDGDIYLQDTLIKPNYSICCDVINSGKFKQNRYYKEIANALVTEGINDIIPNYSFREIIPNIGLLSIDNIEEKNKFIKEYYNLILFYNNKGFDFLKKYGLKKTSAAITQTLLSGYVIGEYKHQNKYEHLSGDSPAKFKKIKSKKLV